MTESTSFDRLNYVGNYLKPGPSTTQRPQLFLEGTESIADASLYFTGNVLEGNDRAMEENWRASGFYYGRATLAAAAPFPAPQVTTEPAAMAYERVLGKLRLLVPPVTLSTPALCKRCAAVPATLLIPSMQRVAGRQTDRNMHTTPKS